MLTYSDLSVREHPCVRCRRRFTVAAVANHPRRGSVLALMREGNNVSAIMLIRELTSCGLPDAKATFEHLVIAPGECHTCGHQVLGERLEDCPACGALNISLNAE